MKNGLLEPCSFMTIRVSSRKGSYPTPIEFADIRDEDYGKVLSFVHAECGGELKVAAVQTSVKGNSYFSIDCTRCGSNMKMLWDVFCGDVSSLAVHRERWVAGAYQFVLASCIERMTYD